MPLFIQKIPHLLFGVSQRPNVQKDPSQLQSCDNWLARAAYGLAKRPPFVFLGKLTSTLTGIDGASIFSIQRDDDDRYRVVIQNGTIKAYDMLNGGAEVTIVDRTSDSYLTDSAGAGFRQVTVGDATFITNRGVEVAMEAGRTPQQDPYALITVEQADFSTYYEIRIGGRSYSIETVDQGDSTSRGQLNTTIIAEALYYELTRFPSNLLLAPIYDIQLFGSTIYIRSRHGIDFTISTYDGLSDNGLRLIKGAIQDAEDLAFTRAPHGLKVEVTGDPSTEKDDYWLEYDVSGLDPDEDEAQGVWRESVAPGVSWSLDKATMPHKLGWKVSQIGGQQEIEALPPQATVEDYYANTDFGGWDEDQDGTAVTEEDDDIVTLDKYGRRRLIPGADGTSRATATVIYDIDTSRVVYGKDTIVNFIHRTNGGTETTLERRRYQPGETYNGQIIRVESDAAGEGTWAATDRFKLELEYGDGQDANAGEEAVLTMLGGAVGTKSDLTPRYTPIEVKRYGGLKITFNGSFYREGTVVTVTLAYTDIVDEFQHTVSAGGQTAAQVAASVASTISTGGITDYTATVISGSSIRVYVTGDVSADPSYSNVKIDYLNTKAVIDILTTTNEFVGETIRNLTDGSEGTITANTDDGVFTVSLSGGDDNRFEPGDLVEVVGDGGYFVWETVTWDRRRAGDEVTNPNPSFVGTTIRDIFFYRNRLGMVAGRGVVLSESGDLPNFFRTSVQQLLDGDRIDVSSAHGDVAIFHSAIPWNQTLYLWSENAQYEMYGEPVLTPKTVKLDVVSRYFNTPTVRPIVVGPRLYFAHKQGNHAKVMEWLPPTDDLTQYLARDITQDVPTYIPGTVLDIAGDYAHGILAVVADGDQDSLYIWSFTPKGDGTNIHEAWQRWTLPAGSTVRQIDFADGKLGLLYSYSDGVYVDEADVDQPIEATSEGFVDRRGTAGDTGIAFQPDGTDPATLTPIFEYEFETASEGDGVEVANFADSTANDIDLTRNSVNEGYTARTGGPTGLKYAEWNPTESMNYDNSGGDVDLTQEMTAIAVIRIPDLDSQNAQPIFSIFQTGDLGNSAGEIHFFVAGSDETNYATGELAVARPYVEDPVYAGSPTLVPENSWCTVAVRIDSSKVAHLYINGVDVGETLTFTNWGTAAPLIRVGAFRSQFFTAHLDGDLAYLAAFESDLGASAMLGLHNYLSNKYISAGGASEGTVTLPYPVAVNGSEGTVKVWRKDTGAEVQDGTRPTTTSVGVSADLTGVDFDVGVAYEARARLAPLYLRGDVRAAETGGRTQIRELDVQYNNTESLKVEVTPLGRSKYTHTVTHASPTEGRKRVPVLARGEDTVIELVSDTAGDARVNSIDVEMQHSNRSRRA